MTHRTAQGLASLGRGPDTELVHMTKGEVHGLQSLAKAHGGSLTINPHTGLAEAGFLSSILPMVAGAAAMYFTGGAAAPWIAGMSNAAVIGAGIGGATTLATGSLKKGLMAGLGAYGGAGLAGGIAAAGTGALSAEAGAAAPSALGAGNAVTPVIEAGAAAPSALAAPVSVAAPTAVSAPAADMTAGGYLDAPMQAAYTPPPMAATIAPAPNIPMTDYATAYAKDQAAEQAVGAKLAGATQGDIYGAGLKSITASPTAAMDFAKANSGALMGIGASALGSMGPSTLNAPAANPGMIRPYTFSRTQNAPSDAIGAQYTPGQSTRERQWFNDQYTAGTPYKAPGPEYMAGGGIARAAPMNSKMAAFSAASDKLNTQQGLRDTIAAAKTGDRAALSALQGAGYDLNNLNTFAGGGPVEQMSNANAIGANTGYPMADIHTGAYATPYQQPMSQNVVQGAQDAATDPYTGQATFAAGGGISNLGGYSDGGRLLRGPGDGVSDSIPAQIGQKQPARLADGEFVVPARIVSELGNGSTEAGSRQLYAMMDRVQNARKKSIGKDKVATNSRAAKLLPA